LQVKDEAGRPWLRIPPLAQERTLTSSLRSGRLAERFGGYRSDIKGKKEYHEVLTLPLSQEDFGFLKDECTAILLEDAYIFRSSVSTTGFMDTWGQEWSFPKHKGISRGAELFQCVLNCLRCCFVLVLVKSWSPHQVAKII
jgi:hypothetical protein